jgi:hypothetical protein
MPVAAVAVVAVVVAAVDDEDGVQWWWTMKMAFNGQWQRQRSTTTAVGTTDRHCRGNNKWALVFGSGDGDGRQLWQQRWTIETAFNGDDGGGVRWW